VHNQA